MPRRTSLFALSSRGFNPLGTGAVRKTVTELIIRAVEPERTKYHKKRDVSQKNNRTMEIARLFLVL
jgi:hypothetical protein